MSPVRAARRVLCIIPLIVAVFLAGCGQKSGQGSTEGGENIQALAKLLSKHMQTHRGQLPKNEAEFKTFVNGLKQSELDEMKITDKAKVFISPRDNQPYVIVYQTAAMAPPKTEAQGKTSPMAAGGGLMAYEKTGVSGKRYIVRAAGGSVSEVTEEEFKRMVPDAK